MCVLLRVYVCLANEEGKEEGNEEGSEEGSEEEVRFLLMVPNTFVWMRYATTQTYSAAGEEWREVLVKCHGHVRETDMGCPKGMDAHDPRGRGWWCYHNDTMKFFVRNRILELEDEKPYIPISPSAPIPYSYE